MMAAIERTGAPITDDTATPTTRTPARSLYNTRVLVPFSPDLQAADRRVASNPELRDLRSPASVCTPSDAATIARSLAASVHAASCPSDEEMAARRARYEAGLASIVPTKGYRERFAAEMAEAINAGADPEEVLLLRLHDLRAAFFAPLIAGEWIAYGLRPGDPERRFYPIVSAWWSDRAMQYRPNLGELFSNGPRPIGGEHREIEIDTAGAPLPEGEIKKS